MGTSSASAAKDLSKAFRALINAFVIPVPTWMSPNGKCSYSSYQTTYQQVVVKWMISIHIRFLFTNCIYHKHEEHAHAKLLNNQQIGVESGSSSYNSWNLNWQNNYYSHIGPQVQLSPSVSLSLSHSHTHTPNIYWNGNCDLKAAK